jgi:hypothetical protein
MMSIGKDVDRIGNDATNLFELREPLASPAFNTLTCFLQPVDRLDHFSDDS